MVIKKSQIAINAADARPNRFIKGDRIDAAIQELDTKKDHRGTFVELLKTKDTGQFSYCTVAL